MTAWDEEDDTTIYRLLSKLDRGQLDAISRSCGIVRSELEKAARRQTKLTPRELKQVSKALRDRS